MTPFVVVFRSADRRRIVAHRVTAVDIDAACVDAIARQERLFGIGSAWFVCAVVQEDCAHETASLLEEEEWE